MKHYLIVHDNKTATAKLKYLLIEGEGIIVHTIQSVAGVRPLLAAFPIRVVFISTTLWDYRAFSGIQKIPLLVILCNAREFMKEELLGTIPYLKEPFVAKDIILLNIKLPKLVPVKSTHFLFIKFERRLRKIMFEQIEMIEKKDNMYSMVHTSAGNMMVLSRIEHWMEKLPPDEFIRIADGLILPRVELQNVSGDVYSFKGREIKLTFKFAKKARKENSGRKPGRKPKQV